MSGSDEYERRYLGGDDARYHEKRVSKRTFKIVSAITALIALVAIGGFAAFVFAGDPQGLGGGVLMGALATFLGIVGIGTSVSRVVVTASELRFMVGLRNMSVPLAAIIDTSLGVCDPATLRVAAAKDGAHIASIFDGRDRYVRVSWRDEAKGNTQVAWIGSETPEALRDAIDSARRVGATTPIRISAAEPVVATADEAANARESESRAEQR